MGFHISLSGKLQSLIDKISYITLLSFLQLWYFWYEFANLSISRLPSGVHRGGYIKDIPRQEC